VVSGEQHFARREALFERRIPGAPRRGLQAIAIRGVELNALHVECDPIVVTNPPAVFRPGRRIGMDAVIDVRCA
jgi:hypothetical protein